MEQTPRDAKSVTVGLVHEQWPNQTENDFPGWTSLHPGFTGLVPLPPRTVRNEWDSDSESYTSSCIE